MAASDYQTIVIEKASQVDWVTLNRPESLDAINTPMVPDADLARAAEPYVDEMLTTSPMGLRLTREGLNLAVDAPSLEAAMAIENCSQMLCSGTGDAREGMRAFLEKRAPVYAGS